MAPHREKTFKKMPTNSNTITKEHKTNKKFNVCAEQHGVQCHNRFYVLQPLENVVSQENRVGTQDTLSGPSKSLVIGEKPTISRRGQIVDSNVSDNGTITGPTARNCYTDGTLRKTIKYDLLLRMKNKTAKY